MAVRLPRYARNDGGMWKDLEDTSSVNCVDTFSFSGDANPFVLADISPSRGIASRGRQGKRLEGNAGKRKDLKRMFL